MTTIAIRLQNTGRNPAVSISFQAEANFKEGAPPYDSVKAWQEVICNRAQASIDHLGLAMFPGSPDSSLEPEITTTASQFPADALTQIDIARRKSLGMPAIAGCIVYKDAVTKKIHWTPVAYSLRKAGELPGISMDDLPLKSESLILLPYVVDTEPPK